MRRLLWGGLTAALTAFLLLSAAVPVLAVDWTEFGGSPERQHRSSEAWTVPLDEPWRWLGFVGLSRSQPLVVGGKLYHLAANQGEVPDRLSPGAGLYCFDLASLPEEDLWVEGSEYRVARLNSDPSDYRPADGHVTYDPGTGGFFWGTADGCLAAWKPGMPEPVFQPLYRDQPGDTRVVSAPLVLMPDVVAVGTSRGGVWVVKGLLTSRQSEAAWVWLPGAVTSSFVKVDERSFLIGVDGIGGHGEVRCYRLEPEGLRLNSGWGNGGRIVTPAGVPASFAVEGPYFYFSDKYGTFYKAELATGRIVWERRFPEIALDVWDFIEYPGLWGLEPVYRKGSRRETVPGTEIFVNNSPAVGDRLVYFTVRTLDRTASQWGPGALLALSKEDGSLVWAVRLAGKGNTCPLVWEGARRVLVGDSYGWITCWDEDTGKPRALCAQAEEAGNWIPVPAYAFSGEYEGAEDPRWRQIAGAAVEITLADGYLIVGGNQVSEGITTGHLGVLRLEAPVNLRVRDAACVPGPVEPGKQATVKATVELAAGSSPVDTWVGWRWKGESEWRKVQDVTLSPEAREVAVSLSVTAPQATRALEVKVNPDELHPANETDYRDNAAEVLVEVKQPPPPPPPPPPPAPLDIALGMVYPRELWTGMAVKVWVETWVAQGPGVTTDVVFSVNGQSARKRVTLPGGKPGAVVRTEFMVEAFEPGTLHLKAVVNPARNPSEVRYDNNVFEVNVPVHYWSQGRKGTGIRVWLSK